MDIPVGSPVPTYKPSALPIMTIAALQRVTTSMGGISNIGTPPTPMPTLGWMGIFASAVHALTKVMARARFHGVLLREVGVDHRAEDVRSRLLHDLHLLVRPHAGEAPAVVLELAVEAEHAFGRHADFNGEVRVLGRPLDGTQRSEELAVAGRGGGVVVDAVCPDLVHLPRHPDEVVVADLESLLGGRTRLGDLALGEQVGRVRERPIRLVVQAQIGHEAVEHRDDRGVKHGLHMVLLQHHDGFGRLHRVVGVADLHGVEAEGALEGAERLLSGEGQANARRQLRRVERVGGAVLAEHRFVAALHAPDAAGAGEHLEEVVELVGLEDGDLAPPRRVGRPGDKILADLLTGHRHGVAVAHAGDYRCHSTSLDPAAPRRDVAERAADARGAAPAVTDAPSRGRR